ncbi:FAD-dependent oxidoreductase [Roseomonas populi]|uniref:FAD-dependent oxidoreductase n=1 Tax=Roseomonas populi TaxID=3121582 RepID=A0ABT1X7Z7_9PROT|nr:FAD-dependent oxidoreductase [Roseomonas pecuniae]MCR0983866.1 FAD-dependent oxidoreductase [Roseomonas pecuniae]
MPDGAGVAAQGPAEEVDLLVIGAGAAGMTAALVAALEGLQVLLCEKTSMVGGTTATSAGTVWVPGTSQSAAAGVPDSSAEAARYLASVIGTRGGEAQRAAFLEAGPLALDDLERRSEVRFVAAKAHPDYLGNHPGAAFGGRALGPEPFDGRLLGAEDFQRVRPPRPEFMVLGGMMVARADIAPLLKPFASSANLVQAVRLLARHVRDRLRHRRGTRLVMGNALVARLLYSLRRQGVPIRFDTALVRLLHEGGRVTGAVLRGPGGERPVRALRGVMLATGGVAWNPELRERLFPEAARPLSLAPEGNTGDGIVAGLGIGAELDDAGGSAGLWMPCSVLERPDGTRSVWPHILLDRAKPGLIAVDGHGRRFTNESDSYHDFCMGMLRAGAAPGRPAHLVCDRSFIRDYGIGLVHQGTARLKPFLEAGYLIEGATLGELAHRIGVPQAALEQTVAEHNRYAGNGVDEAFGKGSSPMNRFNGDPENRPNPCLRPIGPGPFYAVAVQPADLAGSAGLRADGDGRALDAAGQPIRGLYVGGNDMASIFRGTYPGPGTTIGPAMVLGWRTARHAAGLPV